MKTLVINIKNEEDIKVIKAMLSKFDVEVVESKAALRKQLPEKNKIKSPEEFRAMGGILKGQLISKEHLRSISWKNRNY